MTLRPNNLITQQVERMRNLNYVFFQSAKLLKRKKNAKTLLINLAIYVTFCKFAV